MLNFRKFHDLEMLKKGEGGGGEGGGGLLGQTKIYVFPITRPTHPFLAAD